MHERDELGRRLVVRNGHAQPREVMTSAGAIEVVAPRVNDKRVELAVSAGGSVRRFCRRGAAKSPKLAEVLPLLYLRGLSSGDFVPALEQFLGSAAGLSAAAITRLTARWTDDYRTWCQRDLSQVDYVYVWADGIHVNVRLDEDKLCLLVIVGVRADTRPPTSLPCCRSRRTLARRPPWPKSGARRTSGRSSSSRTWWRAVNAPHLVALVRNGATFASGQLVERPAEAVAA